MNAAPRENPLACRKHRPALRPARAVGKVIGSERITELVELSEPTGFVVRRGHKRKPGAAELLQTGFDNRHKFTTIANLAVLARGFEAGGMGEAAGGKSRVNQLPDGEIRDGQFAFGRNIRPRPGPLPQERGEPCGVVG